MAETVFGPAAANVCSAAKQPGSGPSAGPPNPAGQGHVRSSTPRACPSPAGSVSLARVQRGRAERGHAVMPLRVLVAACTESITALRACPWSAFTRPARRGRVGENGSTLRISPMVAAGPWSSSRYAVRQQHGFVTSLGHHHHGALGTGHDLEQLVLRVGAGQRVRAPKGARPSAPWAPWPARGRCRRVASCRPDLVRTLGERVAADEISAARASSSFLTRLLAAETDSGQRFSTRPGQRGGRNTTTLRGQGRRSPCHRRSGPAVGVSRPIGFNGWTCHSQCPSRWTRPARSSS